MNDQSQIFAPRQTNTGLYVQLHEAGFSVEDIQKVRAAYRLACLMFNGRYRKTERAFICHAVGAASSVARFGGRLSLVLAAMLHAAYDSGQFPDGRVGGDSPRHRQWLSAQAGVEVEDLIFRNAGFDFEVGAPERYLATGIEESDRDFLHLALTHELDDLQDFGLMIAPKYGASIVARIEACALLAERIDQADLANTLRAYAIAYSESEWAKDFKSNTLHGYQVIPGTRAWLRHLLAHLSGRFVKKH